jgi:hypothetical protein
MPQLEIAPPAADADTATASRTAGESWRLYPPAAWPNASAWASARTSPAATRAPRTAGLSGQPATARAAGLSTSAGTAGLLVHEHEGPFVVMVPSLVEANRFCLAAADHADHAAGHRATGCAESAAAAEPTAALAGLAGAESAHTASRPTAARRRACAATGTAGAPAGTHRLPALAGNRTGGGDRQEVLAGDGIFEFLADVTSLDQQIDAGGQGLRFRLVQPNSADVLLAAEDELGFLLALSLVTPHGHRDGHQHRHDRERHEQRRHRVTGLAACLTP